MISWSSLELHAQLILHVIILLLLDLVLADLVTLAQDLSSRLVEKTVDLLSHLPSLVLSRNFFARIILLDQVLQVLVFVT